MSRAVVVCNAIACGSVGVSIARTVNGGSFAWVGFAVAVAWTVCVVLVRRRGGAL